MQKVYIGKQTNSVCQLIKDYYDNFDKYNEFTFGDLYYMVELNDGEELDSLDYFYDPYTEKFEKIEGIIEEDHMATTMSLSAEQSQLEQLQQENEELKQRIETIEKLLNI